MHSMAGMKTLQLDASLNVDATGDLLDLGTATGKLQLHSVTLHGDVDLGRSAAQFHLALPSLLGIEVDLKLVHAEAWMRTTIGGSLWAPLHLGGALSDKAWTELVAALRDPAGTSAKFIVQDAVACGTDICDRITSHESVATGEGRQKSTFGVGFVVRRSDGMLTGVELQASQSGPDQPEMAMDLTAVISHVNEAVSISKPTAREMTKADPFRGLPGIELPSS